MRSRRALPLPAMLCAFAFLVCELISMPFTTMNVCDDGPYIRMAHTFANTGHIVYNGWGASMMAAQLCLAGGFIKLFGFSPTCVRMSTLFLAVLIAFVFQRTMVRCGISERNATLGTLAVVLSPMYLMLSVTFMTDIAGLFAITLCLYGCIRALQAPNDGSAVRWICLAIATCGVFGTSRQIAWLGDLVMVPSTLWLLRSRRRVLFAGALSTAVSFVFILGCMHWLANQPYAIPVPVIVRPFPWPTAFHQLTYIVFEIPFLVLPVIAVFIPRIFKSRSSTRSLLLAALVVYVAIAYFTRSLPNPLLRLEPTAGNAGSWVNAFGIYVGGLTGATLVLRVRALVVLTLVCIAGALGVIAVALPLRDAKSSPPSSSLAAAEQLSWKQLGILLLPFSLVYLLFLAAAVATTHLLFDRYAIAFLGPVTIVLVRLYQQRVQPVLPLATVLLILIMGAWGISLTHNTFALDRARVSLADQLRADGVPATSIDGGWDFNLDTELDYANHINDPRIKVPANTYVAPAPAPPGYCHGFWYDRTPHIHAVYGITFDPHACYGRAQLPPAQYRRWPLDTPVNLYVVRYAPPAR